MSTHDDEILGKAYDARLMRRLLGYLRPYGWQAVLALVAIISNSALQLAPPYLTKLAIDRHPVGRLMTRVTSDVDVLNDLFTSGVVSIFGDVFTLLGIMVVLLVMDWHLALATIAVLPLIVLVTQWFRRNVRESYRTVRTWI